MRNYRCLVAGLALLSAAPAARAQQVYFGSLHGHTSYSDGSGTPADAFKMARETGLDFFAVTEHNHDAADGKGPLKDGKLIAKQPALYAGPATSLVSAAAAATKPAFVALYGQEVSTISSGNHINVFDVPGVVDESAVPNGDVKALLAWIAAHPTTSGQPAFLQFNHPREGVGQPKDYGRDEFAAERDWVDALGPHVSLIEVLNAPALKPGTGFRAHNHQTEYFSYLNMGFHLGPSVGQDNHNRNWGTSTDARVGVIADSLTKVDILKALRARRTFASDDKNLKVVFKANGAIGGDIIAPPAPGSELDLQVSLSDPDEPTARYRIDVFLDEPGGVASKAPVETFKHQGNGVAKLDGVAFTKPGAYVLVRVTQYAEPDDDEHEGEDDRAWTAPVWFEFPAAPGLAPPPVPTLRIARLTPDPSGDDSLNEEIVLKNIGAAPVSLKDWTVRDLARNTWQLGLAVIPPNGELAIKRQGQPMSMNNGGDTVELISASGAIAHSVTYGPVGRDQVVTP